MAAERFSGKHATLPILANILLEQEGNTLRVTATNLESAIQITIPGAGSQTERLTVPAKIASSLIQSMSDENVELQGKQGNLHIKTGTRESRINGMPADDFPLMPKIKKTSAFSVSAPDIRAGFERVLPACATSEFRPELGGVYVQVTPHALYFAATDTFRLAEKTILYEKKGVDESFSFILPFRIAQEMGRVLDGDGGVRVTIGDNQALFEMEDVHVLARTIEGAFPEYRAIIPKQFETSCFVKKNELTAGIKASSIFASKLQDVSLSIQDKKIHLNAANQEVGEHKSILACALTGKDVSVSFNYRYLFDGIQLVDEEELFMGFNGENGPCVIRNKEDASFLYVLMPIRLG